MGVSRREAADDAGFDAAQEGFDDTFVEGVAEEFVFDAVIDTGVVIDFDDEAAAFDFLDIDAVEAVADEVGGFDGGLHDAGGGEFDGEGFEFSGMVILAGESVVIDLPVVAGHEVFAGVEGFAVEDGDTPIEVGADEFLGDEEVGVLEELVDFSDVFLFRFDFDYAEGEGGVRLFEDDGEAEFGEDVLDIIAVEDFGDGGGDFVAVEEFCEEDFIRAADDGLGVIDDDEAFCLGFAGEAEGVVIDGCGGADEEGVELGYAAVVVLVDELDFEVEAFCGIGEALESFGIGGGCGVGFIGEDGEAVGWRGFAGGVGAVAGEVI